MKIDVLRPGAVAAPMSRAWASFGPRWLLVVCLLPTAVGAGYVTYARLAVPPAPVVAGRLVAVGKGSIVASMSAVGEAGLQDQRPAGGASRDPGTDRGEGSRTRPARCHRASVAGRPGQGPVGGGEVIVGGRS